MMTRAWLASEDSVSGSAGTRFLKVCYVWRRSLLQAATSGWADHVGEAVVSPLIKSLGVLPAVTNLMVRHAFNQARKSSRVYTNYGNNVYWMIGIVYELKVHHCMFNDQISHQKKSWLFGLNPPPPYCHYNEFAA